MCRDTEHETKGCFWKLKKAVVGRRDREARLGMISRHRQGLDQERSVHWATEAWNL